MYKSIYFSSLARFSNQWSTNLKKTYTVYILGPLPTFLPLGDYETTLYNLFYLQIIISANLQAEQIANEITRRTLMLVK